MSVTPDLLLDIEQTRLNISKTTQAIKKSDLGQYFTPARIASFMASLFEPANDDSCRLLDPGAGIGSLSSAFFEACLSGKNAFTSIQLTAYEIDEQIHPPLRQTLEKYTTRLPLEYDIISADFIPSAVSQIITGNHLGYTHAILNPPYKKIGSSSSHRTQLRRVGIETVNLYTAFVALSLLLLKPGGQLVAIIPRSFCNGPYYRPFRELILKQSAIRHIHLFASRSKAFKDDAVLQENIILSLIAGAEQGRVTITTSTDDTFHDLISTDYPFGKIVDPGDIEHFIHIPTLQNQPGVIQSAFIHHSLDDLGVTVSTGPVVDFRVKEYLRAMPGPETVPLLYPGHFVDQQIEWPKKGFKKPNAICRNSETEKWLYPNGFYCVVRRFSSKEEKRRIVASVVRPDAFSETEMLGFENHLNVFHQNKNGLARELAYGLATYLNSTAVDHAFRQFSGHTQVNATDLRLLRYPDLQTLLSLGKWAIEQPELDQSKMDERVKQVLR